MESTILRPSNPECSVWLVIYVKSLSGFIHPPHMCVRGIKLLFLAIDVQRTQECPVPINYLIERQVLRSQTTNCKATRQGYERIAHAHFQLMYSWKMRRRGGDLAM